MSQSGDEVAADRTPLVSVDVEAVAGGPVGLQCVLHAICPVTIVRPTVVAGD